MGRWIQGGARHLARRVLVAFVLALPCGAPHARPPSGPSVLAQDRAVLGALSKQYGTSSAVLAHLDLTAPFRTRSPWMLVVAQELPHPSRSPDDIDAFRAVSVCFVKGEVPDCSEQAVQDGFKARGFDLAASPPGTGTRPFYHLLDSRIVFRGPARTKPLLLLKACSWHGVDGSCARSTLLYDYDHAADRFRLVFLGVEGTNNNQETRFMESGPLRGDVVAVYPTSNAPYTYFVDVYRPDAVGRYVSTLHFRGRTGYGDHNPLAVIDSEMPEILGRLGDWKRGDALPAPAQMPQGCRRLMLRDGVEWCD